ncbi:MAG: hypothetical protein CMJ77_12700 [Planctomycetaceae bacterium]|nr:hypothetical protein [Planctomycetaceae bacterium]
MSDGWVTENAHRGLARTDSMFRSSLLFSLALSIVLPTATHASLYVPAGLFPGDTYQLVFVSDGLIAATSSDVSTYNNFVQSQAALSSITGSGDGISYSAIVSTSTVDARNNAFVFGPVYSMNGELVATGFTDIWDGGLESEINRDQFGASIGGKIIWTGSDQDGYGVSSFELGSGAVSVSGNSGRDGDKWIDQNREYAATAEHRIYGLSSEITVPGSEPIPEPSAVAIWTLLGCASCAAVFWRKRGSKI